MASRTEVEAIVTFGTQGARARLQKKELSQSKSYKIQGHSRSKNLRTKIKGTSSSVTSSSTATD